MSDQIFATAPDDVKVTYFTAGKSYPVFESDQRGFWVKADSGTRSYCLWRQCAHLHGGDWKRETRSITKGSGE